MMCYNNYRPTLILVAPACKRVREGMCEDGGTQGRDEGEGVWHAEVDMHR